MRDTPTSVENNTCPPPFWNNPERLFSFNMDVNINCYTDILRLFTQLIILGSVSGSLLSLITQSLTTIMHSIFSMIFIGLIITIRKYLIKTNVIPETENHTGIQNYTNYQETTTESFENFTKPTINNPFMNVMLSDYQNPLRPPAAPVNEPDIKQTLDSFFKTQWYADTTDVFGKSQSQRQFITQPSTTIPNDRETFQNWLYKIPGKTCKEGSIQCRPGTDGGRITSLNQL